MRGMVVLAMMLMRWFLGFLESYRRAFRFGFLDSPKPASPVCPPFMMRKVPSGSVAIHEITRRLGMRSMVHSGLGASGAIETQLSMPQLGLGTAPPQIRTSSGSVYG